MRWATVFGYVRAGLVDDRDGHNRRRTESPVPETPPDIEITPRVITERGNSSEQLGLRSRWNLEKVSPQGIRRRAEVRCGGGVGGGGRKVIKLPG